MTRILYVRDVVLMEKRRVVMLLLKSCQAAITLNGIQPLFAATVAAEQGMTSLGHGC